MKLTEAVAAYVAYKLSLGMRFATEARTLKSFYRTLGDIDMRDVDADRVHAFLGGNGPITAFWHRKLSALRGFYRFAIARGYTTSSPLPLTVPEEPRTFVPYIYSRDEMKRLLAATADRERCNLSSLTCRTLLLLLYGTGLRIGEAVGLNLADVDLDSGILCIRESKFYRTRLVPTGPDLTSVLVQYAAERNKWPPFNPDAAFLLTNRGQRLSRAGAEYAFKQSRERAQVRRDDGARYQPRLHDIRHTYSVTRLVTWYSEGADVQRLLPQLATYLGHVHIGATQHYLTMTPELLRQASLRFERYARGGDDHA
ncbi:tyrosine-type recombinase/integrase [Paraburkholderia panacisoli]|uniref:Tyrosine-type recombinase/integrase n=1 Tax=Paraburkholderia panacisoli TaxID=2603818 RepID=A0A5B0H874_9BURK|nr:tyrosine-type recombinase/integrase [Paraburkholderia panacisoli]KAA1011395.1 tyrosine-type recombinase/integrase [Paraburkholderia panacisoli]